MGVELLLLLVTNCKEKLALFSGIVTKKNVGFRAIAKTIVRISNLKIELLGSYIFLCAAPISYFINEHLFIINSKIIPQFVGSNKNIILFNEVVP